MKYSSRLFTSWRLLCSKRLSGDSGYDSRHRNIRYMPGPCKSPVERNYPTLWDRRSQVDGLQIILWYLGFQGTQLEV